MGLGDDWSKGKGTGDKIHVGPVDLHPVKTRLGMLSGRQWRRLPVICSISSRLNSSGPFPFLNAKHTPPMVKLEEYFGPLFLDRLGQFAEAPLKVGVLDSQAPQSHDLLPGHKSIRPMIKPTPPLALSV